LRFPVILKPLDGSSSIGTEIVNDFDQLHYSDTRPPSVAQEYWGGREYTVNLFFDRTQLRCAIPHQRIEIRGGEVAKAVTERLPALLTLAERLGRSLGGRAFGALCFQAIIKADGSIAIFELNARFGGGYPLADHAGATFAEWLVELALGRECSAHARWKPNVLMLRYDASIFHELAMEID
jgi:carbamoyl-phosphate synthase large subunit